MRVVIQRVRSASVSIEEQVISSIGQGLLILLGIEHDDDTSDVEWLAPKIAGMRIFSDSDGKMNLDIRELGGDILVVSQFTLHAATKKGNRPSFIRAARPEHAIPLYENFIERISGEIGRSVFTGKFGSMMDISLINDGPVTIIVDSRNKE